MMVGFWAPQLANALRSQFEQNVLFLNCVRMTQFSSRLAIGSLSGTIHLDV